MFALCLRANIRCIFAFFHAVCVFFNVSAFRLHEPASRRHPGAGVILLKISFIFSKDGNKH